MIIPGIMNSQITAPTASNWVYLGTSGTYNDIVSLGVILDKFGNPVTSCSTSTTIDGKLTTSYPPNGYVIGYRLRVEHGYSGGPCQWYLFEAQ